MRKITSPATKVLTAPDLATRIEKGVITSGAPVKFATLFLLVFACPSLLPAAELRRTHVFGTANADRADAWNGHIDYLSWLDDDTLVYWSKTGTVVCRDVKSGVELWSVKDVHEVSGWSVSRKSRRLAILDESRPGELGNDRIRVLDGKTGRTIDSLDCDRLARLAGSSFVIPTRIALTPDDARLVVACFSRNFGPNAFVLDPTLSNVGYFQNRGW